MRTISWKLRWLQSEKCNTTQLAEHVASRQSVLSPFMRTEKSWLQILLCINPIFTGGWQQIDLEFSSQTWKLRTFSPSIHTSTHPKKQVTKGRVLECVAGPEDQSVVQWISSPANPLLDRWAAQHLQTVGWPGLSHTVLCKDQVAWISAWKEYHQKLDTERADAPGWLGITAFKLYVFSHPPVSVTKGDKTWRKRCCLVLWHRWYWNSNKGDSFASSVHTVVPLVKHTCDRPFCQAEAVTLEGWCLVKGGGECLY